MKHQLIHEVTNLDYDVILVQTGKDSFSVRYGLQIKNNLSYLEAATEYGLCILHSASCSGLIND